MAIRTRFSSKADKLTELYLAEVIGRVRAHPAGRQGHAAGISERRERDTGAHYGSWIAEPEDIADSQLLAAGIALANAIEIRLGAWVVSCVKQRMNEAVDFISPEVLAAAESAGAVAVAEIGPRVRSLLESDIDVQGTTPLALIRESVRYPTLVLVDAGLATRNRDAFAISRFPDDLFDLMPASLSVLGTDVGELAIAWGAAKAFEHKRRHDR